MNEAVVQLNASSLLGGDSRHTVLFYDDVQRLYDTVSRFVAEGLRAGDAAVLVVSEAHRRAFCEALAADGIPVEADIDHGRLCLVDSKAAVERFTAGDGLDRAAFVSLAEGWIAGAAAHSTTGRVRAYGEMVDQLCRAERANDAAVLEQWWNEVLDGRPVSLLCAYTMNSFSAEACASAYPDLCSAHSHMIVTSAESHARLQRIGELSRRLQAEVERRRVADSFRLLVECVVDYAIFMLDTDGHVTTWNAGAQRIKGYTTDEVVGRHFSIFYPDPTAAKATCARELEEAVRLGRFEDEGWRVRKDGSTFWANVVITALHDENGALVGFGKVTRDLTERRRADEDRLRLARAREHNRIKDEFLATASHELRTPLSAILGWARLLETQVSQDPAAARAVKTIVRNAEAQARLIEDLLDASSIVSGKLRLQLGPTDVDGVARAAIDAVRPSATDKGVRIVFDRAPETVLMSGDATRLQQALWNLLSNAVKFSDSGSTVAVSLERVNGHVKLTVRDEGRGIAPEFLPHVFERFRQAAAGTRTGGLGLGLAITQHIAELHGGTVEAFSDGLGKGSTFVMVLPQSQTESREGPPEATRLDAITVLVIEDDDAERELITASLEGRGATVTMAGSVREAMVLLEGFVPQVIVSDIGMPGESGYDFIRKLRERSREEGGELPVIALTGYATSMERRRAFDAGFNNHVPKPLDLEELASVIRNVARLNR